MTTKSNPANPNLFNTKSNEKVLPASPIRELALTSGPPDLTPPTPDPMTWAIPPRATSDSFIEMTETTAEDLSGVEYYFRCAAGDCNDSDWQDSPFYEDTGLQPSATYTYEVKARDKSANQNETNWSTQPSATAFTSCIAGTMHVEFIFCGTVRGSQGKKFGEVKVAIYDNCGNPVSGANVTGRFTGDFEEETISGLTDNNGVAVITTESQTKRPSYTFSVIDVLLEPFEFDPNQSVETYISN